MACSDGSLVQAESGQTREAWTLRAHLACMDSLDGKRNGWAEELRLQQRAFTAQSGSTWVIDWEGPRGLVRHRGLGRAFAQCIGALPSYRPSAVCVNCRAHRRPRTEPPAVAIVVGGAGKQGGNAPCAAAASPASWQSHRHR